VRSRFVHTPVRTPKSLAARGGLARTFGGLAAFAAVILLAAGLYFLQDAFSNPLEGTTVAVIVAAFMIAMEALLLYFLLKPVKRTRPRPLKGRSQVPATQFTETQAKNPARQSHSGSNLPYQRVYVDHSLIRP